MRRKIIFRADGGTTTGMGHFIRTLALAEMLKDDFHCVFVTQEPTGYQIAEIMNVCEDWYSLPTNKTHFDVFLNHLNGNEIVVLDNYFFTTDYQQAIKDKGCKLVCIDDISATHFVSDFVVNHAPGISISDYSIDRNTKMLLGLEYVLLRKPFLEVALSERNTKRENKVFINFGGEDRFNITLKVLSDMENSQPNLKAIVVIGNSNCHYASLNEFINKSKNKIDLFIDANASKMAELIVNCDFAIVPCSTVLFEVISCKLPFITGAYVDNQKIIANYFSSQPNGIVLQNIKEGVIPWDEIPNLLNIDLETIIDGKSKFRFIEKFKELTFDNNS